MTRELRDSELCAYCPKCLSIRLPGERGAQLQAIADQFGLGITETIERFIRRAIEEGVIGDQLPGFEVRKAGKFILFSTPNFSAPSRLYPDHALQLAGLLDEVAERTGEGGKKVTCRSYLRLVSPGWWMASASRLLRATRKFMRTTN